MAIPKYKKFYQLMREQNQALFDDFAPIHDHYVSNKAAWADEFHRNGQPVIDVIRDWERRLCAGIERGNNGQYSSKLAEKFWDEVKQEFSHIELVGVRSNFEQL